VLNVPDLGVTVGNETYTAHGAVVKSAGGVVYAAQKVWNATTSVFKDSNETASIQELTVELEKLKELLQKEKLDHEKEKLNQQIHDFREAVHREQEQQGLFGGQHGRESKDKCSMIGKTTRFARDNRGICRCPRCGIIVDDSLLDKNFNGTHPLPPQLVYEQAEQRRRAKELEEKKKAEDEAEEAWSPRRAQKALHNLEIADSWEDLVDQPVVHGHHHTEAIIGAASSTAATHAADSILDDPAIRGAAEAASARPNSNVELIWDPVREVMTAHAAAPHANDEPVWDPVREVLTEPEEDDVPSDEEVPPPPPPRVNAQPHSKPYSFFLRQRPSFKIRMRKEGLAYRKQKYQRSQMLE